jgi:ATP/maltotriose-dependent transcriptional regulator MalT
VICEVGAADVVARVSPPMQQRRVPLEEPKPDDAVLIPEPPRNLVIRSRLTTLLDECAQQRITILVAPAGSGKTSALAIWAANLSCPITWIGSIPAGDPAVALRTTLDESPADERRVVIVDDAHCLPAESWPVIEGWLTHQPGSGASLVLASRRDLPLSLVLLELTGQLRVLRADALRFTPSEAHELVLRHAPSVSEADAVAVEARADGWAAALVLGARALARAVDHQRARDALTVTNRPILDYLLSEVFGTLPATVRHVLLATADADGVTAEAARLLSADPHAHEVLAELAHEGLLVTEYDAPGREDGPVWRYHPLLTEMLRRQVAMGGPDHELAQSAHRRAATHYAVHGPVTEAIRHAVLGGFTAMVIELLVDEGSALLTNGQQELVDLALRSLTGADIEENPALLSLAALAHSERGNIEIAARLSAQVIKTAKQLTEQQAGTFEGPDRVAFALLADVALLNSWRFRIGWTDVDIVISQARQLLGCQPAVVGDKLPAAHRPHISLAPLSPPRTVWLLNELTSAEIWTNQLAFAAVHNRGALSGAAALGHSRLLAAARINRGLLHLAQGRGQDAAGEAQLGLSLLREHSTQEPVLLARAQLIMCWQQINELHLAEAADTLNVLGQRRLPSADPLVDVTTAILRAFIEAELGDVTSARRQLRDLTQASEPLPASFQRMLLVLRARWAWTARDVLALRHAAGLLQEAGWNIENEVFSAACLGLEGDPAAAVVQLEDLLVGPLGNSESSLVAMAAAIRFQFLLDLAGPAEAVGDPRVFRAFYDLLDRLEPQRRLEVITFLDPMGTTLLDLLRQDTARHQPHPLTALLRAGLARYRQCRRTNASTAVQPEIAESEPLEALPRPSIGHSSPSHPHFPPLSGRELEVLRELALGGSYAEIARSLYVTPNTAKTHILHIYRKLGVDRRGDALRQARALGLIT